MRRRVTGVNSAHGKLEDILTKSQKVAEKIASAGLSYQGKKPID